jgi:hypothetical protein
MKRRALPLDQTVRWLPLDDAYYLLAEVMTSARALPLVVMQEALLEVEMHASSEVYGSTCGVLCGAHYRDPSSRAEYILVEGIERATRVYRHADPDASLAVDLSRAIDAAERAGRMVIGWYRFDVALFPRIPVADAGIHRALFPEPWQVALLRDGADGEGSGIFMRVEPTEGRAFPIPFFELIPKKRARGRQPKRTSVQWRNYNAESEVVALPVNAFRSPTPRAESSKTNGASNTVPRAGIFSRLGARLSVTRQERPLFPHKSAERVAADEAPPSPSPSTLEPQPPPAERWTPPEAAEAPHAVPTAEWQAATPEAATPEAATPEAATPEAATPEAAEPPEVVELPEAAESPETMERPLAKEAPVTAQAPEIAEPPELVNPPETGEEAELAEPPKTVEPPEMVAPPEAAEAPEIEKAPEAVEVPETVEQPEVAEAPDIVEPRPGVGSPEELPIAFEQPVRARSATEDAYLSPTEELDALFTEWQPGAAGRSASHPFGARLRWPVSASTSKRAVAAAIVLAAAYFGVQRIRAESAGRQSVAAGAVSAERERTEGTAAGSLAEAAASRPTGGGFSPAERAEVRSALSSINESRIALVAHLDTLESTLRGSASDSSASERCAHAGALYQRSLDDIARIDLARQKLTSLVGPMRMAGIDSLSTITSDLHQRLRAKCPQ